MPAGTRGTYMAVFHCSERTTVRRLFHEMEGCSMAIYALRRRAFRAFEELLNTDDSLADIAHRCGFYDQAHFTKVFATLFGDTPGRLRRLKGGFERKQNG